MTSRLLVIVMLVMGLGCVLASKRTGDEELLKILGGKPKTTSPKKYRVDQDVSPKVTYEPVAPTRTAP